MITPKQRAEVTRLLLLTPRPTQAAIAVEVGVSLGAVAGLAYHLPSRAAPDSVTHTAIEPTGAAHTTTEPVRRLASELFRSIFNFPRIRREEIGRTVVQLEDIVDRRYVERSLTGIAAPWL